MESFLDTGEFFAPAQTNIIDSFIGSYNHQKEKINELADMVEDEYQTIAQYFLSGNNSSDRYTSLSNVKEAFKREGAVAALNTEYWSKTLRLTDVFDCMPAKRRDEWNELIRYNKCPEYTAESVRPTIEGLLTMRAQFFGERVDGIFRSLSGEHVTNSPMAFGKRMIISYMMSYHGDKTGHINDLRCVIAKFMGRDQPEWYQTSNLVQRLQHNTGVWYTLDGGALRIKLFKKGTAHLEIHPDMAWKLNAVLASIYPNSIPAEFRTKPKKQDKSFEPLNSPVPFQVLKHLIDGGCSRNSNAFSFHFEAKGKPGYEEAREIIEKIGGVKSTNGLNAFDFEYDPRQVISKIIDFGCLPDEKSHQYYPTPEHIAKYVVDLAEIEEGHTVLEPSAGQGNIAAEIAVGKLTCVEISKIHSEILKSKVFNVIQGDFLELSHHLPKYDRIVMNPPFADSRWLLHLKAAVKMLKPGGKLIAVLPSSAKNNKHISGIVHKTFTNEFDKTGVSVTVFEINN